MPTCVLLTILCALTFSLSCRPTPAPTAKVTIIAFNDFHGNLLSPGTFSTGIPGQPSVPSGGADYLAAYIAQLASQNPNHAIVSSGDIVGASELLSAFYHDEPTIQSMNLLGLDFSSVGNHEFDAGPAELLRKQSGGCFPTGVQTCLANHPFPGASFKYLAANVVTTATGKTLFPPYAVKAFDNGAVRVAFIGVGLTSTPDSVIPTGVTGLTFKDEADTINALIPDLHAQGINAIVVLVHQGGFQKAAAGTSYSINDCAGLLGDPISSPILGIVSRLHDGVDLIISAHTHVAYNCLLPNSAGHLIPTTQASAFGRLLTNVDLDLDKTTGRVTHLQATNILVSQPAADADSSPVHPFLSSQPVQNIRALMTQYNAATAPLANKVIGAIQVPLTNNPSASGEDPAGDLIADSELAATAPATLGGAQISFVNQGGIRNPGLDTSGATYPHNVTYREAFNVLPFGNSLVTMTLTAQQIKDLLEQQFAGCNGQTSSETLQVSNGFHFEWSASATPCSKIKKVTFQSDSIVLSGAVQHPTQTYRVVVNNFLAPGGDRFAVLSKGTNPLGGAQDIDALVNYLAKYQAPAKPYAPLNPTLRIVELP